MIVRILPGLCLALVLSAVPAHTEEEIDPKYYCDAEERFLSDEEFIRLALGYELEKKRRGYRHDHPMPQGYEIGSVDEFLKNDPECCSVFRGVIDGVRPTGGFWAWVDKKIRGQSVVIAMFIPSDKVGGTWLNLLYFTDECGNMNDDRTYSITNFRLTG